MAAAVVVQVTQRKALTPRAAGTGTAAVAMNEVEVQDEGYMVDVLPMITTIPSDAARQRPFWTAFLGLGIASW